MEKVLYCCSCRPLSSLQRTSGHWFSNSYPPKMCLSLKTACSTITRFPVSTYRENLCQEIQELQGCGRTLWCCGFHSANKIRLRYFSSFNLCHVSVEIQEIINSSVENTTISKWEISNFHLPKKIPRFCHGKQLF